MPSFEGNVLIHRHQITSLKTRDSRLSCGEDPESLSDRDLIRYRVVTDGQTDRQADRITIADTRLAVPAKINEQKLGLVAVDCTVSLVAGFSSFQAESFLQPNRIRLFLHISP